MHHKPFHLLFVKVISTFVRQTFEGLCRIKSIKEKLPSTYELSWVKEAIVTSYFLGNFHPLTTKTKENLSFPLPSSNSPGNRSRLWIESRMMERRKEENKKLEYSERNKNIRSGVKIIGRGGSSYFETEGKALYPNLNDKWHFK